MKIVNFALVLAASLCVFTSCSNDTDEVVNNDVKVKKVIGVGAQTAVSRTAIYNWDANVGESVSVHWQEDDDLTIFASGHSIGDTFSFKTFEAGESHNQATFEGYTYENGPYYILHPAQSDARLEGDKVKLNIPSIQNAVKNSFDSKANILIEKTASIETKTDLLNVCAYFRITVPEDCSSVEVEATEDSWHLAGTVTVDNITSAGNHIAGFEPDCTHKIELKGIKEAGTYFIAFIPTTAMNSNLKVTVNREVGPVVKTFERKSAGFSFAAGNYYNLGESW